MPEGQCDGGVTTSPPAVSNPEYFEDDLPAGGSEEESVLAGHPMRLRIQSTESTASDHDEYDRLKCSSHSATPMSRSAQAAGGMIDVACAHAMFAESVL